MLQCSKQFLHCLSWLFMGLLFIETGLLLTSMTHLHVLVYAIMHSALYFCCAYGVLHLSPVRWRFGRTRSVRFFDGKHLWSRAFALLLLTLEQILVNALSGTILGYHLPRTW